MGRTASVLTTDYGSSLAKHGTQTVRHGRNILARPRTASVLMTRRSPAARTSTHHVCPPTKTPGAQLPAPMTETAIPSRTPHSIAS